MSSASLRQRCTAAAMGEVVALADKGLEQPTVITVRYTVAGQEHQLEESLKLKTEAIRLCGIPVGQRKVPAMAHARVGGTVAVMYDPAAPDTAFLPENIGRINC